MVAEEAEKPLTAKGMLWHPASCPCHRPCVHQLAEAVDTYTRPEIFLNFRHESRGMGDSLGRSRDSEETRGHIRDDRVCKHGHNILNTCMKMPNM